MIYISEKYQTKMSTQALVTIFFICGEGDLSLVVARISSYFNQILLLLLLLQIRKQTNIKRKKKLRYKENRMQNIDEAI